MTLRCILPCRFANARGRGCSTCGGAVVAILALLLGSVSVARAGATFDDGALGVVGLLRAGGVARFAVTLHADGQGAVGSLSAGAAHGSVARAVDVPPLGELRWEGAVHVPALASDVDIAFTPNAGSEAKYPLTVTPTVAHRDIGLLAVTSRRGTLSAVDRRPASDWLADGSGRTGDIVGAETASPSALPRSWLGWSGVDILVWTGIDPRALSLDEARREALLQWVARGGLLVCAHDGLMDGWSGQGWSESFVGPVLPTDPTTQREITLWDEPVRALTGERRPDADVILEDGGVEVVTARRLGLGRVIYVAVSPRALSPQSEARLWRVMLRAATPGSVVAPPATAKGRERLLTRLEAGSASGPRVPIRTRRLMVASGLWLCVVLVLGVWHTLARPRFGWIVVALAVAGACAVPIVLRSRTQYVAPRELGVLRMFPEIGAGYWYGVVSVPAMEERDLRAEFSADVHFLSLEDRNRTTTWMPAFGHTFGGASGPTGGELRDMNPHASRRTYWHAQAFLPSYGRVSQDEDGAVANHTELAFRGGVIVHGNRGAAVGPLEPGGRASYELEEIVRRQRFWSRLAIPEAAFSYWAREGVLDALTQGDRPMFVGWATGVVSLGTQQRPSPDSVLLVIAPLDTTASTDPARTQNR